MAGSPGVVGVLVGHGPQRGDQAELVEHPGAEAAHDPLDLIEAGPSTVPNQRELLLGIGRTHGEGSGDAEQDDGETLPDLVVKLLGDAPAFVLLRRERAGVALGPFFLQAFEQRVEAPRERSGHGVSFVGQPLAGGADAETVHTLDESIQRCKHTAQQQRVGGEDHDESARQHRYLVPGHLRRHGGRREHQDRGRDREHSAVDEAHL
jgi:hypothetical protein